MNKNQMVSITSLSVSNTERTNGRNLNTGYNVFTNMHSIVCWSVLRSNNHPILSPLQFLIFVFLWCLLDSVEDLTNRAASYSNHVKQ